MFTKRDEKENWRKNLDHANRDLYFIKEISCVLTVLSQWTQIMSGENWYVYDSFFDA